MKAITDAEFDKAVLQSDLPVVVDVWAAWCPPCRALSPILNELSTAYDGQITFTKVDADVNTEVTSKYDILRLPTILIFQKGEVVKRIEGALPRMQLHKIFDEVLYT